MGVIMLLYYVITAFLVVLLAWNFAREKKSVNDMILISARPHSSRPALAEGQMTTTRNDKRMSSRDRSVVAISQTSISRRSVASRAGRQSSWSASHLANHRPCLNGSPIVAGPGVTNVIKLSEFLPALRGTMVDTNVYVLEGQEPGGKVLVIANTHANEPAGLLAALIMIENAVVEKGTLYVIPEFNASAAGIPSPATAIRCISTSRQSGDTSASGWETAMPPLSSNGPTPTSISIIPTVSPYLSTMSGTRTGPGRGGRTARAWSR